MLYYGNFENVLLFIVNQNIDFDFSTLIISFSNCEKSVKPYIFLLFWSLVLNVLHIIVFYSKASFFIIFFFIAVSENWKIQPFVFPPSLAVGTRASTVCATTYGTGLKFQWLKNGKILETSTNVQIRSYADSSVIVIQNLKEQDSGNYTCIAKSDLLTDSYTASLVVLSKFLFTYWLLIDLFKNPTYKHNF